MPNQLNSENQTTNIDENIPEIKIENDNDKNENSENGEEIEKININYGDDNFEEIDEYRIKPEKKNNFLYVSYSTIGDNLINRKVEIKEFNIKNTKSLTSKENSKPYLKKKLNIINRINQLFKDFMK